MTDHEGVPGRSLAFRNLARRPAGESLHVNSGRDDFDWRGDAAFLDQLRNALARGDDRVAKVGVLRAELDDELLECRRIEGNIMGVFLVQSVMCENDGRIFVRRVSQGRIAQQIRMVRVNYVRLESVQHRINQPGQWQTH